jgi:serine/threonine protein kinase
MDSLTQPVAKQAAQDDSGRRAKDWLDALTTGSCDQDEFFSEIGALVQVSPETGWELLGLVDQYYRRGRLSAQTFGILKTHLQGLLVGQAYSDEVAPPGSAPMHLSELPSFPASPSISTPSAPVASLSPVAPLQRAAATMRISSPLAEAAGGGEPKEESSPRLLAVGDLLRGRYLVRGTLGRGGMGTVYSAVDQFRLDGSTGDQKVALKVLHTEIIKRPRLFAELRREFQYLQKLSHPNIVRVHEFDRDGELAFFTMEHLSGALLSTELSAHEGSRLHRPYALAIIRDVASAVAHAHTRGVVHGDLNPGNIFITNEGEIRVLDFGASHQLHRGPWISEFDGQQQIAVATPAYASCQVLEGDAADARDDVYALACIAYQLMTGKLPFGDKTALKARSARLRLRRPEGLRQRQWNALKAGLRFDRERRPSDMRAWIDRLDVQGAAPHLPHLVALWTDRRRSHSEVEQWKTSAITAVIAVGMYWMVTHLDFLAHAGSAVSARAKSLMLEAESSPPPEKPFGTISAGPEAENQAIEAPRPPAPTVAPAQDLPTLHPAAPTRVMSMTRGSGVANPTLAGSKPAPANVTAQNAESPRSRLELAADDIEVAPGEPMAHIVIRRKGSLHGDVSFNWWTESGTAKPGRDFVAVKTHVEHLDNGQSSASLMIPVVQNPVPGPPRSFYVVIDEPSDNATLGPRTLTMITIPGTAPDPGSQ